MTRIKDKLDTAVRYARHLALPEIGATGQAALREATVMITGLGGLGSAAAQYLAASGVGRLALNDFDRVDASNLQRQVLYRDQDVGRGKTGAAAAAVAAINPEATVTMHDGRLSAEALADLLAEVDLLLDCSDNFGTRYTLNEAAFGARVPLVAGAAVRMDGHLLGFDFRDGHGPCYACLYAESDETLDDCAGSGVLSPLVGVIGALQAVEAVRIITGIGTPYTGRLLRFDAAEMSVRETRFEADPDCRVCGHG